MKKVLWVALLLAGCGNSPVSPASNADAVVVDGGGGDRSISVTILPPQRAVQAIVHRWAPEDVYEYRVSLVGGTNTLTAVVPRKGTPKSRAVFTHLRQGTRYEVSLTAWGNPGGTAPSTLLNSVAPTAWFDFSGTQDVEDTATASLGVSFDAVPFDGTGTVTIQDPADGTYQNPTAPETGTAQ